MKSYDTETVKDILNRFMNGPLIRYLEGHTSYSKFKEEINREFGTKLSYSDIYPSPIFNGQINFDEHIQNMTDDLKNDYDEKLSQCHQYGLCASGDDPIVQCSSCPRKYKHHFSTCVQYNEGSQKCVDCFDNDSHE